MFRASLFITWTCRRTVSQTLSLLSIVEQNRAGKILTTESGPIWFLSTWICKDTAKLTSLPASDTVACYPRLLLPYLLSQQIYTTDASISSHFRTYIIAESAYLSTIRPEAIFIQSRVFPVRLAIISDIVFPWDASDSVPISSLV